MSVLNLVVDGLKNFVNSMNEKGVPLPMVRSDGKASMTATMTWLSFNTALLGQIGKFAGFLGGIDLSQANYLFLMCLGAYLGRRIQGNGSTKEVKVENP